MLVKMICPRCGASLEIDDQQEIMTCKYCGYQQANLKERVEVTHIIDRSNDPNLYITYNTTDPNVQMVTRIVSTGQKNTYINGQSMSFHLPAGQHEIILKIGKKNYSRTIVIPDDNQPVRISAGFSGRANIGIDQPNYRTVGADGRTVSGSGPIEKKKQSVFGIIGFILSLTMYLSPLGLALGILDSVRAKNDPDHAHGLGKAAIIIGGIMSVLLIVTISSCGDSKNTGTTERATAAVTEKAAETTAQSRSEAENVSKAADEIRDEVKEDVESAADELSSAVDEIAALIGFGDDDETETEVTETEVTEEETEAAGNNKISIGEEFGNRTVKGAVISADLDYKGYNDVWTTVEEGFKAVYVRILMTNTSNSSNYVSVGDFECYVDNIATNAEIVSGGNDGYNANIAPGRSAILGALYVVPAEEKTIELEYNPIGEFSKRQIIVVQDGSETGTQIISDQALEEARNTPRPDDVEIIGIGEEFGNKTIKGEVMEADIDYKGYNDLWTTIPEGYKAIYIKIKVTNISSDTNYVSVGDFSCYTDNIRMDAELVSGGNEDYNANIDPERSAILGAMYVIPEGTKSIELEYDPLGELAKRVIIKIQ